MYIIIPYFKKYSKQIDNLTDLYLSVFYPKAMYKSNDYILGGRSVRRQQLIAKQNKGFDLNNDGKITRYEIDLYINNYNYPKNKNELLNLN